MSRFVVDASVAAKWFTPEEWSGRAVSLQSDFYELIAPDLLWIELANVFATHVRAGRLPSETAAELVAALPAMPVDVRPTGALLTQTLEVAMAFERSIYDAMYVALAIREECPLVTADRRLYNALGDSLPGRLAWIGDLPEAEEA